MAYKFTRGVQIIGDLSGSDDSNRDTGIDFEEDEIKLVAGGTAVLKISGSHVYLASGSTLHLQEGITLGGQNVLDSEASLSVGSITLVDQSGPLYQLPDADGESGQVIMTDGDGNLAFSNVSGASGNASQFFQGHVEIDTTAKPVNFHNVVSIGANVPENFRSWFIAPFSGQINKVILSVKANNFSTSNHGTITVEIYKNQSNFNSATSIAVAADNFAQTVNNLGGGSSGNDVNTGIFNTSVSIQEGDLIQIKVGKSTGASGDVDNAIVTLRLTEQ